MSIICACRFIFFPFVRFAGNRYSWRQAFPPVLKAPKYTNIRVMRRCWSSISRPIRSICQWPRPWQKRLLNITFHFFTLLVIYVWLTMNTNKHHSINQSSKFQNRTLNPTTKKEYSRQHIVVELSPTLDPSPPLCAPKLSNTLFIWTRNASV